MVQPASISASQYASVFASDIAIQNVITNAKGVGVDAANLTHFEPERRQLENRWLPKQSLSTTFFADVIYAKWDKLRGAQDGPQWQVLDAMNGV